MSFFDRAGFIIDLIYTESFNISMIEHFVNDKDIGVWYLLYTYLKYRYLGNFYDYTKG